MYLVQKNATNHLFRALCDAYTDDLAMYASLKMPLKKCIVNTAMFLYGCTYHMLVKKNYQRSCHAFCMGVLITNE